MGYRETPRVSIVLPLGADLGTYTTEIDETGEYYRIKHRYSEMSAEGDVTIHRAVWPLILRTIEAMSQIADRPAAEPGE